MQTPTNTDENLAVSDGGDKPPLSDVKVDKESARMLYRLRRAFDADGEDDYLTSSSLRRATELDDTTSVNYRMDEHLIPGELAAESVDSAVGEGQGEQPREFYIKPRGREWLDDHPDTPLPPDQQIAQLRADLEQSIEEIETTARAAQMSASSADEEVESLSGQLGGLKSRLNELSDRLEAAEDTLAATREAVSNQATVLEDHADRLDELSVDADDRDDRLDRVDDRHDELESRLSRLSGSLSDVSDKLSTQGIELSGHGQTLESLRDSAADRDDRLDALEARQDEILDRLDTPWWRRIL